jgi:hypothetical protein
MSEVDHKYDLMLLESVLTEAVEDGLNAERGDYTHRVYHPDGRREEYEVSEDTDECGSTILVRTSDGKRYRTSVEVFVEELPDE